MCYHKLGKLEGESLKFVDKAIENNPEYVKALYRKAVILKDLKEYRTSISLIKRILSLDPQNKEAQDLSNSLKSQLVQEDTENKNPLIIFKREYDHIDGGKVLFECFGM